MSNLIITISREHGSGGTTIGKLVAKQLGIPCYDKAAIDAVAQESGLSPEVLGQEEQTFSNSILFNLATSSEHFGVAGASLVDQIYIAESNAIREFAKKGSCVIVGRCADYVLREHDCFRVFIYADMHHRMARMAEFLKDDKRRAEKQIRTKDKVRARHYNFYCDQVWGDRRNYHLMINSGNFGMEKSAEVLLAAAKQWEK